MVSTFGRFVGFCADSFAAACLPLGFRTLGPRLSTAGVGGPLWERRIAADGLDMVNIKLGGDNGWLGIFVQLFRIVKQRV